MSKQKRKNRNIFKQAKSILKGVKNKALTPFKASKKAENIGDKAVSSVKNKFISGFKDLFTFQGSEKITQIENTVSNVKSAIENPTEYAGTYIKNKILNKLLTGLTDLLSAGVSVISKTGGEVVKQVGKQITKKLTEGKKETETTTEETQEQQQEQQEQQEEQQQEQQEQQKTEPWQPTEEQQEETEETEEGTETMTNYISRKLNELPTQLLVMQKNGSYKVVSIEGYRNMLINIFRDKISRNKDAYEGSSASEFITVYNEFNRDYESSEGEELIKINYESLFDWLAF